VSEPVRRDEHGTPHRQGAAHDSDLADRLRCIEAGRQAAARRVIDYVKVLVPLHGCELSRVFGEVVTKALEQALSEHEAADRQLRDELRRLARE